jgi:hypothetical protein
VTVHSQRPLRHVLRLLAAGIVCGVLGYGLYLAYGMLP